MTVKEHYDNHLADFYSWMLGDFNTAKNSFKEYCTKNEIKPGRNGMAIDLGAGNGIQSIALAELGFKIKAVDFNEKLLAELESRKADYPVEIINDNMMNISIIASEQKVDLISCCGDTISHLDTFLQLDQLLEDCYKVLTRNGRLILTFRDYSIELTDTQRFIPVKSDENRILTCVIDFFNDKIRVTDLLYEKIQGKWIQKISSYNKLRVSDDLILEKAQKTGFSVIDNTSINRMTHLILQK